MRVGVKYCGNCNPRIDAPGIIKTLASAEGAPSFVRWSDPAGYDVLLIFSGCQVGCASHPPFDGPVIVATSESIQRQPVEEGQLADALMKELRALGRS